MGNYSVTFLQAALDDLEEILLYVARDSKENAFKLTAEEERHTVFHIDDRA